MVNYDYLTVFWVAKGEFLNFKILNVKKIYTSDSNIQLTLAVIVLV